MPVKPVSKPFFLLQHQFCFPRSSLKRLRWQHHPTGRPEPDPQLVVPAEAPNGDLVVVLQELAALAAQQLHLLGALPAEFEHRPERVRRVSADRSAGHQVTRLEVAPGDGVVGDLLQRRPVQVSIVGPADGRRDTVGS